MILTATTSPEDYFRYICQDDVAKEMFEQYCIAMQEEIADLPSQIDEQSRERITMLEEDLAEAERIIDELDDQVRGLVEERDKLDYELNELEIQRTGQQQLLSTGVDAIEAMLARYNQMVEKGLIVFPDGVDTIWERIAYNKAKHDLLRLANKYIEELKTK